MPPTSVSAPSSESLALTIATAAPEGIDPNIKAMIDGDLMKLKGRDESGGIRRKLHRQYGVTEREMNEISVSARSGLDQEAFDALLAAYLEKQEREKPAAQLH